MKKNYLWSILAMMMVVLSGISFTACGDDDDEVIEEEPQKDQGREVYVMMRSPVKDLRRNTVADGSGINFNYRRMEAINFHYNNSTALYYELHSTESVPYLKQRTDDHGETLYNGTWTVWEEHPEWSLFNGSFFDVLSAGLGYTHIWAYYENPRPLTFTLYSDGRLELFDNNGKKFRGTYYVNMNPSNTYWDEMRDQDGNLQFIVWDTNAPLDNSRFE